METALVSIISLALIVVGGMTMSRGFLFSVDTTTTGLNRITSANEEMMRTDIAITSLTQPSANRIRFTVPNEGKVKLASFSKWDLIVQYYDSTGNYHTSWVPYVEGTAGNDEWTVTGIYTDAGLGSPEVFEPDILNPGEEMVIETKLIEPVGIGSTNQVTISTPNGVTASAIFTR